MKKVLLFRAILCCCCAVGLVGTAGATDQGPAEMTLQATVDPAATPKPAPFPHGAHQERMACGSCHHGKDADDKKIDYAEGQKIEKCEICHHRKASMPEKINTYKNAAHALCQDCHKKTKPELAKCSICHRK